VIRRVQENPGLVRASILIKLSDLTNEDNHAAPLEFQLPEDIKVISTEPSLTTVTYTATELSSPD